VVGRVHAFLKLPRQAKAASLEPYTSWDRPLPIPIGGT
jgi:hypothetical protein